MARKNIDHIRIGAILLTLSFSFTGIAATKTFDPNNPTTSGYVLTFDDEFNGSSLDTTKWTPLWNWGGGLSTTYPDDEAMAGNITVSDSIAHFKVYKPARGTPLKKTYATSVATTKNKFSQQYGYFEARVKMPASGKGLWPAFWLVPADGSWPPEIDIMEWLGNEPAIDHMTVHYDSDNKNKGNDYHGADFSAGFHILGMLWTQNAITWYIDGREHFQSTVGIPHKPMIIILSNDTDSPPKGWNWQANAVDSTTAFPASFDVDYVRAYAISQ